MVLPFSSKNFLTYATIAGVLTGVWMCVALLVFISWNSQRSSDAQSLTSESMPMKTYPVRIQYQTQAGTVIKVGSQRIYYASQSAVRDSWAPVIERYYEHLATLSREISAIQTKIVRLESELETARSTAAESYREAEREVAETNARPAPGRKRLAQLLAAAAEVEDAEKKATTVVVRDIQPIKKVLNDQRQLLHVRENELRRTRDGLPDLMFSSLPRNSAHVTTDENGVVNLELSSEAKFYCWAEFSKILPNGQPESLRWLLLLPDNLDANGVAVMSHDNTYQSMDFKSAVGGGGESDRVAPVF